MAANRARELLQLCSLSWVPGFIMPRVPWPGPMSCQGSVTSVPVPDCWSRLALRLHSLPPGSVGSEAAP